MVPNLTDQVPMAEQNFSPLDMNILRETQMGILENIHGKKMANEAQIQITNLVQQAQRKRLSVYLLTPKTLKLVFQHLQYHADKQGLELLISKPLDLFQIDTLYLHANRPLTLISSCTFNGHGRK